MRLSPFLPALPLTHFSPNHRLIMSVVSLAIINRENKPLYVREFGESESALQTDIFGLGPADSASSFAGECSVRQQFILQEGLERLVHVGGPGFFWRTAGATGNDAKFVGLLFPSEEFRVYGYLSTTKVKIIVVVEDDVLSDLAVEQQEKDAQIKAFMTHVHTCYVNYLMNPFNKVAAKIQSEQFDQAIEDAAMSFNQEV